MKVRKCYNFGFYGYSLSNIFQVELLNISSFDGLKFGGEKNSNLYSTYLSKNNIETLKRVVFQNQSIFRNVFINFVPTEIDFSDLRFDTNNHHHGGTIIETEKKTSQEVADEIIKLVKNL